MLGEYLLTQLKPLRENNVLCDLDLIANDRTIVTMHQIVFTALHRRHFEWAVENASTGVFDVQSKKRMILSCLDADELRLLVQFMYGKRISDPQRNEALKKALDKVNMSYLLDTTKSPVPSSPSNPPTTVAMKVEPQDDFPPASNDLVIQVIDQQKGDPTGDYVGTVEELPKDVKASISNEQVNTSSKNQRKVNEEPDSSCNEPQLVIGENQSGQKSADNKSCRSEECNEDYTLDTIQNTHLSKRTEIDLRNRCARSEKLNTTFCENPNIDKTKQDESTQSKIRNMSEEFEYTCIDEYDVSVSDEQLSNNILQDHSGDKMILVKIAGNDELEKNTFENSCDNMDLVDIVPDGAKCFTSTENDVRKNLDLTESSNQNLMCKSKQLLAKNDGTSVVNKTLLTKSHDSDNGNKTNNLSPKRNDVEPDKAVPVSMMSEHTTSETGQEQVSVKIEPEYVKESKVGEEKIENAEDRDKDERDIYSQKNNDSSIDTISERVFNSVMTSNITSSDVDKSPPVTIVTIKEECHDISVDSNSENSVEHQETLTVQSEPEVSVTNSAVHESNTEPNTKCPAPNRKPLFRKRSSHEAEIDDRKTIAMYYKQCEENAGILCKQQHKGVSNSETSDLIPVRISVLLDTTRPLQGSANKPIKQEKVDATYSTNACADKTTEVQSKHLAESFANPDCLQSTYLASSSLEIISKSTTAMPNPDIIVVPPSIVRKYISPSKNSTGASCAKRRRYMPRNSKNDLSHIGNSNIGTSVLASPCDLSPQSSTKAVIQSSTKVVIKNVDDSYSVVKVNVYDDQKKEKTSQGKSCDLVLKRVGNMTCNIPIPIKESSVDNCLEALTSSIHVDNNWAPTVVSKQYGNQSPINSTLLSTGFEQTLPVVSATLPRGIHQGLPVVPSLLSGGLRNNLSGVPTILSAGIGYQSLSAGIGYQSQFDSAMMSAGFKKQLAPTFLSTELGHQLMVNPSILSAVSGHQSPVAPATCTVLSTVSGKQFPELSTLLSTASACSNQLSSVVSSSVSIQSANQKPVVSSVFTSSKPLPVLRPIMSTPKSASIPPVVSTFKSDMSWSQTPTVTVSAAAQSSAQKYVLHGSLPFLNPSISGPVPLHISPIRTELHKNESKNFSSPTSVDIVRYRVSLLTHLMGQSQPKQPSTLLTASSGMKHSVTSSSTWEPPLMCGEGPIPAIVWKNNGRQKSDPWMCDINEPMSIGQDSDDEDEPLINVKKKLRTLSGSHVNSIKPSIKLDGMGCEDSSLSEDNQNKSHFSILDDQTGAIVHVNIARDETKKGSEGLQDIHLQDNIGDTEDKEVDVTGKTQSSKQEMKGLARLVSSKRSHVGTKRKLKELVVMSECYSNYSSSYTDKDDINNVSNKAMSKSGSSDKGSAVKTSSGENSACLDKEMSSLATKAPVLTGILSRRLFPNTSTTIDRTIDKIICSESEQASQDRAVKLTAHLLKDLAHLKQGLKTCWKPEILP